MHIHVAELVYLKCDITYHLLFYISWCFTLMLILADMQQTFTSMLQCICFSHNPFYIVCFTTTASFTLVKFSTNCAPNLNQLLLINTFSNKKCEEISFWNVIDMCFPGQHIIYSYSTWMKLTSKFLKLHLWENHEPFFLCLCQSE
jgi:hypothetical protein